MPKKMNKDTMRILANFKASDEDIQIMVWNSFCVACCKCGKQICRYGKDYVTLDGQEENKSLTALMISASYKGIGEKFVRYLKEYCPNFQFATAHVDKP